MSAEEAAMIAGDMWRSYLESGDYCMIGTIVPIYTNDVPENMLLCDGQPYYAADYPKLYAVIHDSAKDADGERFFTPELQGKFLVSAGSFEFQGSEIREFGVGEFIGDAAIELGVENLPAHGHTTQPHAHSSPPHTHAYYPPVVNLDIEFIDGAPDVAAGVQPFTSETFGTSAVIQPETVIVNETGEGEYFEIIPPAFVIRYAIVAR